MAKQSKLKDLQAFFNIGTYKPKNSDQNQPTPTRKNAKGERNRIQFPDSIKKLWDWYMSQTNDSSDTLRERFDRYKDLEFMVYNDTIVSMAADLYADEASQIESNEDTIGVEAPKKEIEKECKRLLSEWGITQNYIRDTAYNTAFYGDSFDINSINMDEGVTGVTSVNVHTVQDRYEFLASEVEQKMHEPGLRGVLNQEPRLKSLARALKTDKTSEHMGEFFKPYLFGFKVGDDLVLPPWNVNHHRMFSSTSEFHPWGRSLFVNMIGPFRQLKASKNLMAMARAAKFPKEHFEVETSERMTEAEKWDAVNEAREEYHNLGGDSLVKDEFSVGGEIWTPEGLLKHNLIENNMNLEDIADIELLRDDMIIGSRIPKGYLIVDRSSFGTSGQSLLQQFKPFGRAVFTVQSAILEQLTRLLKIHFLITGQFDGANTEFELTLPFPVVEEAQDRLSMKNDTLRLASDIVSNIQDALGTRDGLPPDVIKSIFSQISFLEPEDVDMWLDRSAEVILGEKDSRPLVSDKKLSELDEGKRNKITNRLSETLVKEAYFSALKQGKIDEGVFCKKHFRTSFRTEPIDRPMFEVLEAKRDEHHGKRVLKD